MFDILIALGILFGAIYLVWSLIGIALTVYVARSSLRVYRQRATAAQTNVEAKKGISKGLRQDSEARKFEGRLS